MGGFVRTPRTPPGYGPAVTPPALEVPRPLSTVHNTFIHFKAYSAFLSLLFSFSLETRSMLTVLGDGPNDSRIGPEFSARIVLAENLDRRRFRQNLLLVQHSILFGQKILAVTASSATWFWQNVWKLFFQNILPKLSARMIGPSPNCMIVKFKALFSPTRERRESSLFIIYILEVY